MPINMCPKYFMINAKIFWPSSYMLNARSQSNVSLPLRRSATFRRMPFFNESIVVLQKLFIFCRSLKIKLLNLLGTFSGLDIKYYCHVAVLVLLYDVFYLEVENI